MLTSKLSKQLTATLADLDAARSKANEYQNKWTTAEDALRREKARSRQMAEENNQLQDVISALRSLVADKTAVLEATRTKLEEEKRVTTALSEDHIRLMEDTYAQMSQPSTTNSASASMDSLVDASSYHTAKSSTSQSSPNGLRSESRQSLGEMSFYSAVSKRSASPSHLNKPTARHQLFSLVTGRALLAVEMTRNEDTGLGFTFACQTVSPSLNLNDTSSMTSATGTALQGVFVKAVREGSVAEQTLLPGDEIVELNNMFCRGVPHPVVAMKLKGLQGTVNLVIARPLQSCGLTSPIGAQLSAPVMHSTARAQPPVMAASLAVNDGIRDMLQEMMQELQCQLSEEQRQIREEIAVCNRSVVSVQIAVEDALSGRHDKSEVDTPTGSTEHLDSPDGDRNSPRMSHRHDPIGSSWNDEQRTPVAHRISQVSVSGRPSKGISPADRAYDELLKAKQQLMEQLTSNGELQASAAALRAECSAAVLRARQAESMLEDGNRALKEAQAMATSQQETCQNMVMQLSSLTGQSSECSTKLAAAEGALTAKDFTIGKLLEQEQELTAKNKNLERECQDAKNAADAAMRAAKEHSQKDSVLQSEKKACSEWQEKAREAQEQLFHVRSQLSASESQLSHWQLKEQQLQGQLTKITDRLKKTEAELLDSKQTTDRFEAQLRTDRKTHEAETQKLTEQACAAEMELQEMELKINQEKGKDSDRVEQLCNSVQSLTEECELLRSQELQVSKALSLKDEELLQYRHKQQHLQQDCERVQQELNEHLSNSTQQSATVQTLNQSIDELTQEVRIASNGLEQSEKTLAEKLQTIAELTGQLEAATDLNASNALEKTQLQSDLDNLTEDLIQAKSSLKKKTEEAGKLLQKVSAMGESQGSTQQSIKEQETRLSSMKTIQSEQAKEITSLKEKLTKSEDEVEKANAELKSTSATIDQLKASDENHRSRELASTKELKSQRTRVQSLEASLQQETTRREVLEKEQARLEKTFQSVSEASKSMSSSSADQLKSMESQLREERQQLLQSRTDSAGLQTKLKAANDKIGKQRSRIDALQNETTLLQQTTDMLKAACQDSDTRQQADTKLISELQRKTKSLQSSLDATNDVTTQLQGIVEGNAQELGELKGLKSKQAAEITSLRESNEKLKNDAERVVAEKETAERTLQRTKHELVLAEDKLAMTKESVKLAQETGKSTTRRHAELEVRCGDAEQRLAKSERAKADIELQLKEVLSSSSEQLRDLMKKVDRLTSERQALEESKEMTKASLLEQSRRVEEERDVLQAKLRRSQDEARAVSEQADTARSTVQTEQMKVSRLQSELERSTSALTAANTKLTAAEDRLLELKTSSADLRGRFDAQQTFATDLQEELTRLQAEKKSLSKSAESSSETVQELTTAITDLRTKLQDQDQFEHLSNQRVGRLRQELKETQDSSAQLQAQLKEERSYVGKVREQNQALSDANGQLKTSLELMMRQADGSSTDHKQVQAKVMALQRELDDSRTQADLFSASQAAVKESLTAVLKEREDLLVELEQAKLTIASNEQRSSLLRTELDGALSGRKVLESENEELAKQIPKMTTMQVELFDAQTSVEQLRREASKHQDVIHALRSERDKLRDIVQLQETEQIKHGQSSAAAAGKSKGKLTSSSNKKDLFSALTSAEGEAHRLQEYVEKMMTVVIEKAPQLLEAISQR